MDADGASSRFQGVDKSSTAYRLLSSMGWEEGQGLGAQKQGIATHVRVKRKADASGVGAAQEAAKAKDWTLGMAAYDRVLATLKHVAADCKPSMPQKKQKSKAGKKGSSKESGKEESLQEDVGRPQQERKATEPAAKRPKISKADGTAKQQDISANFMETADKNIEAPQKKKLTTHVGRFQKVARNKHVKGYSATDLAAILGANGDEQVFMQATPSSMQAAAKPGDTVIRSVVAEGEDLTDGSDVAETGTVWWRGHFVKAGRAGSSGYASFSSGPKKEVNIAGFSEADQANLWQNVTDAQSKSKQGLGQGSALKIPAKERWQGQKLRIDDSDEEENDHLEETTAQVLVEDKEAVTLPSKRDQAALLANASDETAKNGEFMGNGKGQSRDAKPLKWKKISRAILEAAEGSVLSLKTFKTRAWEVGKVKGAGSKKQSLQDVMAVLSKSKQFTLSKSTVRLA